MSETIDLAKLDDAGFDRLYRERIEPLFEGSEGDRQAAVKSFRNRMTVGVPLAGVAGLGVGFGFQDFVPGLMAGVFGVFGAYAYAQGPVSKVAQQVKHASLGALATAIGATYQGKNFSPVALDRFRGLNLLPSYDRSSFEDCFAGSRLGCSFELYEAHLEDERRDKDGDTDWVTVFRGQLIRVHFPKQFQGVTVVRRDAGIFNGLSAMFGKLERVGLTDPKFEKAFEVYGSDQVEARYLVHPVFMERLLEIERTFEGKRVRCGFTDGDLIVAVEGGDKFEPGSMFKPLADPERARKIVGEIAQILKLMDAVLTAEQGPLVARGIKPA
jgi:hypothetical protein